MSEIGVTHSGLVAAFGPKVLGSLEDIELVVLLRTLPYPVLRLFQITPIDLPI